MEDYTDYSLVSTTLSNNHKTQERQCPLYEIWEYDSVKLHRSHLSERRVQMKGTGNSIVQVDSERIY